MMKKLIVAFAVAGLALSPVFAKPLKVPLKAENGSRESGYALLYPHGSRTRVVVHLHGTPKGVVQPEHIHPGSCPNITPRPAYMLKSVRNGKAVTMIHVRLKNLLKRPFAINVHASHQDMQKSVACGDIRAQ
ncbi:hypothetical protein [Acidiferrobacter sp.]